MGKKPQQSSKQSTKASSSSSSSSSSSKSSKDKKSSKKDNKNSRNNNGSGQQLLLSSSSSSSSSTADSSSSGSGSGVVRQLERMMDNLKISRTSLQVVLPPLPNLPVGESAAQNMMMIKVYRGPTEYSNWVIPGVLLVGGFPRRSSNIVDILNSGIDTVVCLVERFEMERINSNYEAILQEKSRRNSPVQFVHFPIRDCSVAPDMEIERLVEFCCRAITQSERRLFVHCVGGHGRGGTLICLLLAKLYGMSDAEQVMSYCQVFHDTRVKGTDRRSPQVPEQRSQIHRFVNRWNSVRCEDGEDDDES